MFSALHHRIHKVSRGSPVNIGMSFFFLSADSTHKHTLRRGWFSASSHHRPRRCRCRLCAPMAVALEHNRNERRSTHRSVYCIECSAHQIKNPVYHVSHLLNKNIAHALHINSLTLLAWGNRILLYCAPTSMNEQQMRLRARFSLSITYTGMHTHTPASCALIVSVCTRKMALAPQFSQKKISIIPALIPIVWIDWQTYKCACEMNWETATNQTRINSVSGV